MSAQLVPARIEALKGHASSSGSRRASLEVPTGDSAAVSADGPSSTGGALSVTAPSDSEWEIRVDVVDQGIGISAAEIGTLFQSFRQAKKVQMAFGGTGLGLAISRSVDMALCYFGRSVQARAGSVATAAALVTRWWPVACGDT